MLARDFAKQIIDDPQHDFTHANVWTPRGVSYDLRVDFCIWQAVHQAVRELRDPSGHADLAQLAELATSEAFNSGCMSMLVTQFSELAPSLTGSCLEAGAILATVNAMIWLLDVPSAYSQELDKSLTGEH
jgi:hypothetical protein